MSKDARRHSRVPFIGPVRLSWEDSQRETRFANAKCIDVSQSGIRIECPVPIPAGCSIILNAERIRFSGGATVKHVSRYGARYIMGLEMAQIAGEKTLAAIREPWALRGSPTLV